MCAYTEALKGSCKNYGILGNLETFKENNNLNICWRVPKFIARNWIHQQILWLRLLDKIHNKWILFCELSGRKGKKAEKLINAYTKCHFHVDLTSRCHVNNHLFLSALNDLSEMHVGGLHQFQGQGYVWVGWGTCHPWPKWLLNYTWRIIFITKNNS